MVSEDIRGLSWCRAKISQNGNASNKNQKRKMEEATHRCVEPIVLPARHSRSLRPQYSEFRGLEGGRDGRDDESVFGVVALAVAF